MGGGDDEAAYRSRVAQEGRLRVQPLARDHPGDARALAVLARAARRAVARSSRPSRTSPERLTRIISAPPTKRQSSSIQRARKGFRARGPPSKMRLSARTGEGTMGKVALYVFAIVLSGCGDDNQVGPDAAVDGAVDAP